MKKTILVLLFVLLGVTAQIQGQRKIATDKLQIKSLPNVGVLGTDAKGNLIESADSGGAGNLQQVLDKGFYAEGVPIFLSTKGRGVPIDYEIKGSTTEINPTLIHISSDTKTNNGSSHNTMWMRVNDPEFGYQGRSINDDADVVVHYTPDHIQWFRHSSTQKSATYLKPTFDNSDGSYNLNLPAKSGTIALLSDIQGSGGGGAGNLQQVLDKGNTAVNKLIFLQEKETALPDPNLGMVANLSYRRLNFENKSSHIYMDIKGFEGSPSFRIQHDEPNQNSGINIANNQFYWFKNSAPGGAGGEVKLFPVFPTADTQINLNLPSKSGTIALLSDIQGSGGGNTPNLQQVLTKGNRAKKNIELESNAYDNFSILRNDKLVLYHDGCYGDCSGIENLNLDSDNNRLEEDDLLTVIKPSSITLKNTTHHPHAPNNTAEQGVVITPNIIKQYGYKNSSGSEIISSVSVDGFNIHYSNLAGTTYDRNKIIVANGTENLKNTVSLELPVLNSPATPSQILHKRVIFPAPTQNVDTIVYKSNFNELKTIKFNPTTAPTSPTKGTIYFDSSDNKLKCYDGTAWHNLF